MKLDLHVRRAGRLPLRPSKPTTGLLGWRAGFFFVNTFASSLVELFKRTTTKVTKVARRARGSEFRRFGRIKAMQAECYNPQFPRILRLPPCRGQRVFLPLVAFAAFLLPTSAAAQQWDSPAHAFAEKILARAQARSALSLNVKNISSLSPAAVAEVRRALESELRRMGANLVAPEQAVEEVRVTLSANSRGYVWVAEVGHADSWEVVMLPVAFSAQSEHGAAPFVLRRTLLLSQPEQILDVAAVDGNQLVLGRDSISLYRTQNGKLQVVSSVPLMHSHPWPRDLRGRLVAQSDGSFRAYLPGVQCAGATQPQLTAVCQENDDPWPLSPDVNAFFSTRRNFFTGAVKLARNNEAGDLGPFYSAALFPQGERGFWIVAFVSGGAQLVNAKGQFVSKFANWGSDITGINSDCGSGWQVLAGRTGDSTPPDSLQAYEVVNREAVEAGSALEFPGPINALWSGGDGKSAVAVSHNLNSGNYEAFSISAACGR